MGGREGAGKGVSERGREGVRAHGREGGEEGGGREGGKRMLCLVLLGTK